MTEANGNGSVKAQGHGRYLVAVKYEGKTEIFAFTTPEDRQHFLADLE
jgi:hypothetical protein